MKNLIVVRTLAGSMGEKETRKILKMLYRTEVKHPATKEYVPDDFSTLCFLGKYLSGKAEDLKKLAIGECDVVIAEAIQEKNDSHTIEVLRNKKKSFLLQYLKLSHMGEIIDSANQVITARELETIK